MGVDVEKLVKALRLHKAWSDGEKTGPDYGCQTRDTHPDGEKIWRIWWDNQLSLCDRAVSATDEALARIDAALPTEIARPIGISVKDTFYGGSE